MMDISKMNYHQARPFWVTNEIEAISCSSQYGNPSGHSMVSLGMTLAFWLDYNTRSRAPESKVLLKAWYWRALFLCLCLAFAYSIGYSRMFLGVHSINQVLFGQQLGAWYALSAHYILREPLIALCNDLTNLREQRLMYLLFVSLGLLASIYALQILNEAVIASFENPAEWTTRISETCPEKLPSAFQADSLPYLGNIAMAWGAFVGFLAQARFTPGIIAAGSVPDGEKWLFPFMRVLMAGVYSIPWALLIELLNSSDWNAFVALFFAYSIPKAGLAFNFFFVADYANRRLGLLKKQENCAV